MSLLTLKHVFGLKSDVRDCIHFVDEANIVFPAGYNVVVQHLEKRTQRHVPLIGNQQDFVSTGQISALALSGKSTSRVRLLAVAERGNETIKPSISLFEMSTTFKHRGKTLLQSTEMKSNEFISMCFSPDGKTLLTLGGAPDYMLIHWLWDKGRPLQQARVSNSAGAPMLDCSFCPTDPSVVCVSGLGVLRFLHIEHDEFKAIPFGIGRREPAHYLSHCWIEDRVRTALRFFVFIVSRSLFLRFSFFSRGPHLLRSSSALILANCCCLRTQIFAVWSINRPAPASDAKCCKPRVEGSSVAVMTALCICTNAMSAICTISPK